VTLRGEPYLLWRAVDEHGAELDVLVQKRRDKAATKRIFQKVLRSNPVPRKIVTDQLRSYPAAKADIPELAHVKHVFVKAAARVNNRAEKTHQPTRRRERQMCGFRDEPGKDAAAAEESWATVRYRPPSVCQAGHAKTTVNATCTIR
jgi:putative transposase